MERHAETLGLLERHFGFRRFLDGQEEAIGAILNGEDVLIVMPTLKVASHRPQSIAEHKRNKRDRGETSYGGPVFEALREWRREKAIDMGNIPPYLIYTDKNLERTDQTHAGDGT